MENAVQKAIRLAGGPTLASFATRASAAVLYKWARRGKVKDTAKAVLLSRATGGRVTVEELAGLGPSDSPNGNALEGRKLPATSPDSPATKSPLLPAYPASPGTATAPGAAAIPEPLAA